MNRLITRSILAFVGLSLAAVLLPLLGSGGTSPLFAALDRSTSLAVYAGFLVVFCVLLVPGLVARAPDGTRRIAWAAVLVDILMFAAIPLVFTAYISGVSARGLLPIGALCAAAAAVPLVALRAAGSGARRGCWILGSLFLFALPALDLWSRSVGEALPEILVDLSPMTWIHRIGRLRETPPAWPFLGVMAVLWIVAMAPLRLRTRSAAVASAVLAVTLLAGAASGPVGTIRAGSATRPQALARIESGLRGVARPGLRTPLRVQLAPGVETLDLTLGGVTARLDGASAPHEVLAVPGKVGERIELASGARVAMVAPPYELLAPQRSLVAWCVREGVSGLPEAPRSSEARRVIRLSVDDLPGGVTALEAVDALVIDEPSRAGLNPSRRRLLRDFAALGGHLIILETGATEPSTVSRGFGEVSRVAPGAFERVLARPRRTPRPVAEDPELVRTFARPDWQEMDLSQVILFAVLYHLAFLAAFLLPLLLDSRKALPVYLASVGFVVLVVAVGGFKVLQGIFLRDNQVYTQSIGLVILDRDAGGVAAARRFHCYASMSGEQRTLELQRRTAPVAYRPIAGGGSLVRRSRDDTLVFEAVRLDRFDGKVLVRDDLVSPSPWRFEPEGSGFRLVPRGEGEDPLGLRTARRGAALLIEGGRWSRRLRWEGRRLVDDGAASGVDLPGPGRVFYRKLVGHFAPRSDRYLLVQVYGLTRPDDTDSYLWTRDLGAWVVVPLPGA